MYNNITCSSIYKPNNNKCLLKMTTIIKFIFRQKIEEIKKSYYVKLSNALHGLLTNIYIYIKSKHFNFWLTLEYCVT
jgi:hypothetical protein